MNTEKEKEKETMEVEKITLERLLLMAGRDAEAEIKKRKANNPDEVALEAYIKAHPEDPDPIGSFVLQ